MSASDEAAFAYHEPPVEEILIHSSFLLLLNVLNWAFDTSIYCGLIGQILVGIAWGTPGGQLLSPDTEHVVVQLGYIGLILLVFEGGLSTSFPSLKANICLSAGVAITGIAAPIGLSFILAPLVGASNLQCFAAGAALCSTSLGTTFTVLRTSGLTSTRLGVVLTCAAMLDDVVGLVMVQVVSNLGDDQHASVSAVTVVRPILVSIAFIAAAVALGKFVVQPVTLLSNKLRMAQPGARLDKLLRRRVTALTLYSVLLIALVVAASYAGTSNLFAAYIAGAVISWWDSEVPHPDPVLHPANGADTETDNAAQIMRQPRNGEAVPSSPTHAELAQCACNSGSDIYQHYYHPAVTWILQPFFFASIGFSIPISRMFTGSIIWRGLVYSTLMMIAKMFCALWLIRVPELMLRAKRMAKESLNRHHTTVPHPPPIELNRLGPRADKDIHIQSGQGEPSSTNPEILSSLPDSASRNRSNQITSPTNATKSTAPASESSANVQNSLPTPPKPLSLYPGAIIGLAMVPRGEIGFLISSVGQSNGIFGESDSGESEIFLIVTWAIVLCTFIGPLCVGLLVRRVKRLDNNAASSARREGDAPPKDVLGVWGVQALA